VPTEKLVAYRTRGFIELGNPVRIDLPIIDKSIQAR
jgi:hypothetical protein